MLKNCFFFLSKDKISFKYLNFIYSNDLGAITLFIGTVRIKNRNKKVKYIYYSIFKKLFYSLLINKCNILLDGDFFSKIIILQRYGKVNIGEINLILAVSSVSRKKSFNYCNELTIFIKTKLPIWKKEFYDDGSFYWINS